MDSFASIDAAYKQAAQMQEDAMNRFLAELERRSDLAAHGLERSHPQVQRAERRIDYAKEAVVEAAKTRELIGEIREEMIQRMAKRSPSVQCVKIVM